MKSKKLFELLIVFITVLAFTPFIQGGCGGGGGGGNASPVSGENTGSTETTRTLATLDASSIADSLEFLETGSLVNEAFGTTGIEGTVTASSINRSQASIFQKAERILNQVKAETRTGTVHASGIEPDMPPEYCGEGGTIDFSMDWDGPNGPMEFLYCDQINNLHMIAKMNNCIEFGIEMNGTMEVTIPGNLCEDYPTAMDMILDLTIYDPVLDFTIQFESTSMDATNIAWDNDEISGMEILLNGTISGNEDGIPFSEDYEDCTVSFTDNGSYYEISMSGYIQTSCLDGWVEVTTPEPVQYPYDFTCPVGGVVNLRGEGEAVITINSDTSIDISMNGETIQSYTTCEDTPSCLK